MLMSVMCLEHLTNHLAYPLIRNYQEDEGGWEPRQELELKELDFLTYYCRNYRPWTSQSIGCPKMKLRLSIKISTKERPNDSTQGLLDPWKRSKSSQWTRYLSERFQVLRNVGFLKIPGKHSSMKDLRYTRAEWWVSFYFWSRTCIWSLWGPRVRKKLWL